MKQYKKQYKQYKTVSTSIRITKIPSHTHTHTLQNPHTHTHTHQHITKQVKTTTVQDIHQLK
jgi:hypothetical protein